LDTSFVDDRLAVDPFLFGAGSLLLPFGVTWPIGQTYLAIGGLRGMKIILDKLHDTNFRKKSEKSCFKRGGVLIFFATIMSRRVAGRSESKYN
jgi:hypothetical protein